MGHYCKICDRVRANERFSGKGHRDHICKECQRRPKAEHQAIMEADEVAGFLRQSNISQKNIRRLRELLESPDPMVARDAALVLQVALIKPGRKKRIRALREKRPDLLDRLEETGLIYEIVP